MFIVAPRPEVKFSEPNDEWIAWLDDSGVAAVGRTEKEALAKWYAAYWATFKERYSGGGVAPVRARLRG